MEWAHTLIKKCKFGFINKKKIKEFHTFSFLQINDDNSYRLDSKFLLSLKETLVLSEMY